MSISETLKYKAKVTQIDLGIKREEMGHIVQNLSTILASTYTLYVKTHGFHWNVVGPHFFSLHKLCEEHYRDLWEAVDALAERIRALGHLAPISSACYQKFSRIEEEKEIREAGDMIKQLIIDHELISSLLKEGFVITDKARDFATADLYVQRLHFHDKAAWMLRATLGQ